MCGTCQHTALVPNNVAMIECYGAPPTPVVLGGQPDALGRMQLNIDVLRPLLNRNTRACAIWKPKKSLVM